MRSIASFHVAHSLETHLIFCRPRSATAATTEKVDAKNFRFKFLGYSIQFFFTIHSFYLFAFIVLKFD